MLSAGACLEEEKKHCHRIFVRSSTRAQTGFQGWGELGKLRGFPVTARRRILFRFHRNASTAISPIWAVKLHPSRYTGLVIMQAEMHAVNSCGGFMKGYLASAIGFLISLPFYPNHLFLLYATMVLVTILTLVFWTGFIQVRWVGKDGQSNK